MLIAPNYDELQPVQGPQFCVFSNCNLLRVELCVYRSKSQSKLNVARQENALQVAEDCRPVGRLNMRTSFSRDDANLCGYRLVWRTGRAFDVSCAGKCTEASLSLVAGVSSRVRQARGETALAQPCVVAL